MSSMTGNQDVRAKVARSINETNCCVAIYLFIYFSTDFFICCAEQPRRSVTGFDFALFVFQIDIDTITAHLAPC